MGDYLGVLVHGERVLARNPWDVGVQMDMAEAADSLGQLDLAVWLLEQARQKSQTLSVAQPRPGPALREARQLQPGDRAVEPGAQGPAVRQGGRPQAQGSGRPRNHRPRQLRGGRGRRRGRGEGGGQRRRTVVGPGQGPGAKNTASRGPRLSRTGRRPRRTAPAARPPLSAPAFRPTSPTPDCTCSWRPSIGGTMSWNWPAPSCKRGWGRPATLSS